MVGIVTIEYLFQQLCTEGTFERAHLSGLGRWLLRAVKTPMPGLATVELELATLAFFKNDWNSAKLPGSG